jgi:hypothetical protein
MTWRIRTERNSSNVGAMKNAWMAGYRHFTHTKEVQRPKHTSQGIGHGGLRVSPFGNSPVLFNADRRSD